MLEQKPLNTEKFKEFKTVAEFANSNSFLKFFNKAIEKWKDSPSPYINLWYAIYEVADTDTTPSNLFHNVVEYFGYLNKNDKVFKNEPEKKIEIEESVQEQTGDLITRSSKLNNLNKKATIMKLTTPVTTGITYDVNGHDVKTMTEDNLFATAMELKNSIKYLKKCGLKAKAVKKHIKEQKTILRTVIKYLDAK